VKSYTKVYFKAFGYVEDDYIPCEICQKQANDIHHIFSRSKRMDLLNSIENLMAVCRKCHNTYGDKKKFYDYLIRIHFALLDKFNIKYNKEIYDS
jgi:ribosomal protein L31